MIIILVNINTNSPKMVNIYQIQFNYPFMSHNNTSDPFENSLAQHYDLFYPQTQQREE